MMERVIVTAGTSPPRLEPKDAVLLAVLGATQLGHESLKDIIGAAKHVAEPHWQPTGDVVVACLQDAIEAGLIQRINENDQTEPCRLEITEAGRRRLCEVLCSSAPVLGGFGRLCTAMKICFLGALVPHARERCVNDLRRHYEGELAELRRACRRCPCRNQFVRLWMGHEIGRLEWELDWLDDLQADAGRTDAFA